MAYLLPSIHSRSSSPTNSPRIEDSSSGSDTPPYEEGKTNLNPSPLKKSSPVQSETVVIFKEHLPPIESVISEAEWEEFNEGKEPFLKAMAETRADMLRGVETGENELRQETRKDARLPDPNGVAVSTMMYTLMFWIPHLGLNGFSAAGRNTDAVITYAVLLAGLNAFGVKMVEPQLQKYHSRAADSDASLLRKYWTAQSLAVEAKLAGNDMMKRHWEKFAKHQLQSIKNLDQGKTIWVSNPLLRSSLRALATRSHWLAFGLSMAASEMLMTQVRSNWQTDHSASDAAKLFGIHAALNFACTLVGGAMGTLAKDGILLSAHGGHSFSVGPFADKYHEDRQALVKKKQGWLETDLHRLQELALKEGNSKEIQATIKEQIEDVQKHIREAETLHDRLGTYLGRAHTANSDALSDIRNSFAEHFPTRAEVADLVATFCGGVTSLTPWVFGLSNLYYASLIPGSPPEGGPMNGTTPFVLPVSAKLHLDATAGVLITVGLAFMEPHVTPAFKMIAAGVTSLWKRYSPDDPRDFISAPYNEAKEAKKAKQKEVASKFKEQEEEEVEVVDEDKIEFRSLLDDPEIPADKGELPSSSSSSEDAEFVVNEKQHGDNIADPSQTTTEKPPSLFGD